ncbi:MAG TPA: DNA-formamidopyrimidine glycosylase [Cyanobacteria bacterium UBA8803]|nr:DNA-formamidopyrimidine glycosylase [Cyanobacteria bacterium UBA9273]HBL60341.1 DNA-formamidopyrimidine glycosylase [Cyanobacteria bacterium UBA8803]
MPELPEVEIVRQGLDRVTLAQPVQGGDVLLSRTIAHPFTVAEFLAGLDQVTIVGWHRRGKYLLAQLVKERELLTGNGERKNGFSRVNSEPDLALLTDTSTGGTLQVGLKSAVSHAGWLAVHLRMSGQLLWLDRAEPLQKHTRVRLFFPNSRELRFVDQRTFGRIWWIPPLQQPENIITGLMQLGPEPFAAEFSVEYLAKKLHKGQRAIKTALLDQTLVAGVGNIYADEALFVSGIRPETLGSALNVVQIERLHHAIIQVLEASIAAGGTTFSKFLNVQGVNGNYSGVAWVYGRTGKPCRVCNTPIERIKLTGRSSHFCPKCQIPVKSK